MPSPSRQEIVQDLARKLPTRALEFLVKRGRIDELYAMSLEINKYTISTRVRTWLALKGLTPEQVIDQALNDLAERRKMKADDPAILQEADQYFRGVRNPFTKDVQTYVQDAINEGKRGREEQ